MENNPLQTRGTKCSKSNGKVEFEENLVGNKILGKKQAKICILEM